MIRVSIATFLFFFAPFCSAAFINNGDGTITHTDTGLMWLQDANYAATSGYDSDGRMDWQAAGQWAQNLSFAGYQDWRLPNLDHTDPVCTGQFCYEDELGRLFHDLGNESTWWPYLETGEFTHVQTALSTSGYWYSDAHSTDADRAWDFWIYGGYQGTNPISLDLYAWAVRDIQTSINEPGLIFALGLLMLFLARDFFI